jgi:rod shape-determining protein MreC
MYRRSGRGKLLLLVFLAVSILVITLDYRGSGGVLERAKDISGAVLVPIQQGFTALTRPIGGLFSSIRELSDLRGANTRLMAEVEELRSERERALAILSENARLRANLELNQSWASMDKVTAEVISDVPSNYRWAVRIDKGRADGIRRDQAVIDPSGLVGKIIQVERRSSVVLLLIDPTAAARARIAESRDQGIIRGRGGNEPLSLELIGPEATVDVGSSVITAGYDLGIFPPGIPIGTVTTVGGEGPGIEQEIEVEPLVDFTALDFVQVLLESGRRLQGAAAGDGE